MANGAVIERDSGPRAVPRSSGAERSRWLRELSELLAFPTVSAQPRHRADIEAAAAWLVRHLAALGLEHGQVLPGAGGGAPSVYADWLHAPGRPTLLLYSHFDVQPAEPLSAWRSPPFRATITPAGLVARGASDNKGQLFIHLKALERHLAATGRLPLNVKVWLEGEEEIGSPNLDAFLDRELARLRADAVLVSDTEMPGRGRPSLIYGLRGNLGLQLEVQGPAHELHSGRYGGTVLNPLQALCEIVAGLHDAQGRVAVRGFYDRVRPVSAAERAGLNRAAGPQRAGPAAIGVHGWGEEGYTLTERQMIRPSLSVTGMKGGYTGPGRKAVIPARAMARLSLRLVPDQRPEEIAALFERHLAEVTPPQVRTHLAVTGGSLPVVLPRRHPVVAAAARAAGKVWGRAPVFLRNGGSIPLVEQLHRRLAAPVVMLGFGLPDDRIHGANEKLDLPTFFLGIETVARFLTEYGEGRSR